jgi:2-polyprenyl-3-methyl-5-hydroxy-6-metoxy-1,4-benzoquinol methylase
VTEQQDQTLRYFNDHAADWQSKATGEQDYNIIAARNGAVLRVIEAMGDVERLLDVGCGTGQLVIEAARRGVHSVGVDFAADMIERCEVNRKAAGVEASFVAASFFDLPDPPAPYDVVSALGFIEYLSIEQMEAFFARAAKMLRPGGALVVGSRNRLFNALSLNDYTRLEQRLGTLPALVAEAVDLHMAKSQKDAFAALAKHERIDPQPETHPETGIGVATRYQFSPAELVSRLRKHGFRPERLFPVHYHGLPLAIVAERRDVHASLAKLLGDIGPDDHRTVPNSSTFLLDVRRDVP